MLQRNFDDIVFEKSNKEYGAYLLRKKYKRTVIISTITACLTVSTVVLIPFLKAPDHKNKEIYKIISVTMENLDTPVEKVFVPPRPAPPVNIKAEASAKFIVPEVRYTIPEVVDTMAPKDEMIITSDSLAEIIPGQENNKGSGNLSGALAGVGGGEDGNGNNGLYSAVDIMPKFKGGDINKFREWVQKKTKYPESAAINGIQGRVYVTFIVEKDGSVTNGKVVKGVDPLINDEALRAVMSSPKWTPGSQRGVTVRVSYIIMLNFEL